MEDFNSQNFKEFTDSESQNGRILKEVLNLGISGKGFLSGAKALGDQYTDNPAYKNKVERIEALAQWEIRKNFTSGFITSLGGIITLPLAIPASLGINWVLQTRMVAAMAHIGGFNIDEPQVRMAIGVCLLGKRGKEALNANMEELKGFMKMNRLTNIPKRSILLVNQAVASRLMRMAAQKGFSRISKAIPLIGGAVGGYLDYHACQEAAVMAKEMFQFQKGE